jgi:hypothetical protein
MRSEMNLSTAARLLTKAGVPQGKGKGSKWHPQGKLAEGR